MEKGPIKIVAENRKARHDYTIVDQYEAGLVLTGTEVQSLRLGKANLKDSYAKVKDGEVWLYQMHISPYPFAYYNNHDPLRVRKLLLHKREILRLYAKANEQGHTLVPLKLYFKAGKAKITLALAKGKREFDKREALRERDRKREVERARRQR
ncbi:MAG: SsrA-binding protein SmpB [Desulfobacterales bacterium]|jgi:SsrA-binding protein|nr:SsrA-binding protein SmpB [Desulfobacterales bacterium]